MERADVALLAQCAQVIYDRNRKKKIQFIPVRVHIDSRYRFKSDHKGLFMCWNGNSGRTCLIQIAEHKKVTSGPCSFISKYKIIDLEEEIWVGQETSAIGLPQLIFSIPELPTSSTFLHKVNKNGGIYVKVEKSIDEKNLSCLESFFPSLDHPLDYLQTHLVEPFIRLRVKYIDVSETDFDNLKDKYDKFKSPLLHCNWNPRMKSARK